MWGNYERIIPSLVTGTGKACAATLRLRLFGKKKKKKLTFSIHITLWAAYKRHSVSDLE